MRPLPILLSLALWPFAIWPFFSLAQPVIEIPTTPAPTPEPIQTIARPDTAGRVVKVFSFEEANTNPGDVPQNWYRSFDEPGHPRPGFPAWNKAALSYTTDGGVAFAGAGSVLLPTRGGSTSLIVGQGVLPVFQNADYLISAKVKTDRLTHARAALAARFLDKSGAPIPNSDARSPLTITTGNWQDISVELVGEFDQAAYIQLELQLLQPEQFDPTPPLHLTPSPSHPLTPSSSNPQSPPQSHRIWPQDLTGSASFDDVAIIQLPRIELSTTSPCNIVSTPDQPELKMLVRDLTGESLAISVDVLDVYGRAADHLSRKIGAGYTSTTWQPNLARLGWYRAILEITTDGAGGKPRIGVGRSYTDFIWIPGNAAHDTPGSPVSIDRQRFALLIDDLPAALLPKVPDLARRCGLGGITLPVWDHDLSLDNVTARADALRPIINALHADHDQITLSLPRVPTVLAQRVQTAATASLEQDDPWSLLTGESKNWLPYASPFLERFGQRVNHWQIGAPGDDRTYWRKDLRPELAQISDSLAHLVPGPILTIPTGPGRAMSMTASPSVPSQTVPSPSSPRDRRSAGTPSSATKVMPSAANSHTGLMPPALLESIPPATTPQAIALATKAWSQSGAPEQAAEMTLLFEPFPPARYGTPTGAIETAKRAIEFWAAMSAQGGSAVPAESSVRPAVSAGPSDVPNITIALQQPWDWTKDRRPQLMPRPELAVWRTLQDRLAARRVIGTLPVAEGVTCYILAPVPSAPSRSGCLVAWNNSAQPEDAILTADFGDGAVQALDIFGNAIGLVPSPTRTDPSRAHTRPTTRIQLTPTPIFIENIDVPLLRFLSALAVDPPYLESSNDQHERDIVITNPWPTGITGRVTILEPGGFDSGSKDRTWHISPRSARFSVPAGQTERLPIKISFSPIEEVGVKDFVMAIDLAADKPYGAIEVRRTVEVGVKTINLDLASSIQGKDDLVIEAMIANTGQNPLTLEITAFAEGFPRSKASITALTPGNQTIKRFVYQNSAQKLQGQRVVLSVFDPDTKLRVNKSILIK